MFMNKECVYSSLGLLVVYASDYSQEEGDHLIYENRITSSYEYGIGHLGSITRDTDYS